MNVSPPAPIMMRSSPLYRVRPPAGAGRGAHVANQSSLGGHEGVAVDPPRAGPSCRRSAACFPFALRAATDGGQHFLGVLAYPGQRPGARRDGGRPSAAAAARRRCCRPRRSASAPGRRWPFRCGSLQAAGRDARWARRAGRPLPAWPTNPVDAMAGEDLAQLGQQLRPRTATRCALVAYSGHVEQVAAVPASWHRVRNCLSLTAPMKSWSPPASVNTS